MTDHKANAGVVVCVVSIICCLCGAQLRAQTEPRPNATRSSGTSTVHAPIQAPSVAPPVASPAIRPISADGRYVVIGWNDLGMHCISPRFAEMAILPPYNNLKVIVIRRGVEPRLVTSGISVNYALVNNQTVGGKTDFWNYVLPLFGANQPAGVGLTGNGLSGGMKLSGDLWAADGVPVLPYYDNPVATPNVKLLPVRPPSPAQRPSSAAQARAASANPRLSAPVSTPIRGLQWDPYQQASIAVQVSGQTVAATAFTVPVSDEMNCAKCHRSGGVGAPGITAPSVEGNILTLHDMREGTHLMASRPVLCASCHSDNALGTPGTAGVKSLSYDMHIKHGSLASQPACYDCHPGANTQCNRSAAAPEMGPKGTDPQCANCHGNLTQFAANLVAGRNPWVQEPTCAQCHGAAYSTGTTLYRNAKGHGGIYCVACHNSPHAWYPSKLAIDNIQPMTLQGNGRALGYQKCSICHTDNRTGTVPPHDE